MDDYGKYVRTWYQVRAELNSRVIADGHPGTIVGFDGPYLLVLVDGESTPGPWHPTWNMVYCPAR